ncbi:MAG: YcaO-related McrA-glycine thioamidation protein [Candidatus Bathyarchaeota archaeon]
MRKLRLKPTPKRYTYDAFRTIPPKETLAIVRPKSRLAGIVNVEEITNKDRLNLPIFMCRHQGGKCYTGKGFTKYQAEASALMEAIERTSAEPRNIKKLIFKSFDEMDNALDPSKLILPVKSSYAQKVKLRWVEGLNLSSNTPIYVPACSVYFTYNPGDETLILKPNTNGLASGNTYEEAILHGLMEVIERDAWSIVEFKKTRAPTINVESVKNKVVEEILRCFKRANVKVVLKDITSDIGVPTVAAVSEDPLLKDPGLLIIGFGTHLNPEYAIVRALLEVAQNRIIHICGLRRDAVIRADFIKYADYERIKRINRHWFDETEKVVDVNDMPLLDTADILEDIHVTLKLLSAKNLEDVIVVDLTDKRIRIPVVRVIVPGLENYVIEPERVGERVVKGGLKG